MVDSYDDLWAAIKRIEAAAYQRGVEDARAQVLKALGQPDFDVGQTHHAAADTRPRSETSSRLVLGDANERQRAPRGAARHLIERAMRASAGRGIDPADALNFAETDLERMVQASSVRTELRRGLQEERYVQRHGRWFPAGGEAREAGHPGQGSPASRINDGKVGDTHAAALVPDEADRN